MFEMFEVIIKIILLFALFGIAWFDYRTKLIDTRWLWMVGLIGLALILSQNGTDATGQVIAGAVPGVLLLLFSWISGESIGFGDGWLFVVTGIFLGLRKNMLLMLGTLLLAGVFAIFCLVLKKKKKSDRIALAPFVLVTYVGVCL